MQSRRNPLEQRWRQRQRTLLTVAGLGWLAYKVVQWSRQANLDGQVVLITGASRGLGLALAREFARIGCRLVITARDAQELARAQQDLWQRGAAVLAVPCDVTNQEQVHSVVDQATQRFGGVDIVVNNAGMIQVGPLTTTTKEDFASALDVMFWGTLYPTLAVLPQMRARRRGHIVNITSIGGMVSVPHLLPYTCAKYMCQVCRRRFVRGPPGRTGPGRDSRDQRSPWPDAYRLLCAGAL
jgi:NAD(P)-dependent dehydrogenase (short-subunit alcohol dehydrogenase family)